MRNHGTEAREFDRRARAIAGEHVVSAPLVSRLTVCHGPNHCHLVSHLGQVFEILAELETSHIGVNRLVRTSILGRRKGLRVPRFLVSHSTGEVNVNQ